MNTYFGEVMAVDKMNQDFEMKASKEHEGRFTIKNELKIEKNDERNIEDEKK